ncbi:hypothetical protein [Povalibacter sp.]|uniref:hypothetical protein n=1 Tax=Povalibacter sp. TaxID=1962978 RepID=UPI002F3FB4EA
MDYSSGELIFYFLVASALSVLGAWLLAWRFRAAMRLLMSRAVPARTTARPEPPPFTPQPAPIDVSAADNRRAGWRLATLLIGLSILIAISSAALQLALMRENLLTPARTLTLAFVFLWPVIPALAQMWRWSRLRTIGVLMLWCLVAFAVILWRQVEPQPGQAMVFLASEIGPTILLVALLCMGNVTRAIAPLILLPLFILVWALFAGVDALELFITEYSSRLSAWASLFDSLSSTLLQLLLVVVFLAVPCLLVWWPVKWLSRRLAAAYTRQWLSELMILFAALWGIALFARMLGWVTTLGFGAVVMLAPLLWIPVVMLLLRRLRRSGGRAPTLLVLRVFQRDRAMRALFDNVIEHWRLSGNTVLIAGTDLLDRTLDADDIFTFLDGRLAERFISSVEQIPARLAQFELEPDAEGRYRINECYCHDTTWRETLAALLERSDVVLMDLRSFQRRNEGCSFELGELARAPGLSRVVLLTDAQTDLSAAQQTVAAAPAGRFVWLDATHMNRERRREVLNALFGTTGARPAIPLAPANVDCAAAARE